MKKIFIILLLSVGLGHGLRAQFVVTDPTHMAVSAAGFSESIGQALETTGNLLSMLKIAEDQLENLDKTIQYVEKVTLAARTVQSMVTSVKEMESVIRGIDASIKTLRNAVSQKNIGIREATNILKAYTGVMNSLTNVGNAIVSVTTSGMEQMDQFQRTKEINALGDSIHSAKKKIQAFNNGIQERLMWRTTLKDKQDSLSALAGAALQAVSDDPNFMSVANLDNGTPVIMPASVAVSFLNDAFAQMAASQSTGQGGSGSVGGWGMNPGTSVKTAAQAKTAISKAANGMAGLFWAISALIGLLGAVQVYRKYQFGGEDLAKSIAIWGGTTLLLFIVGLIFNVK